MAGTEEKFGAKGGSDVAREFLEPCQRVRW